MPHYHSDRQAVLCPRPPPPRPPDCRGNPRTPAVSRTSLGVPKTDLICIVIVIVLSAKSTNFTTNTRYHVDPSVDEPHRLRMIPSSIRWKLGM